MADARRAPLKDQTDISGARALIVEARFYDDLQDALLDGVSLTVNTVKDVTFSVLIIPHTLDVTTIGGWKAGTEVNIEVDLMARYAARLTEMTA